MSEKLVMAVTGPGSTGAQRRRGGGQNGSRIVSAGAPAAAMLVVLVVLPVLAARADEPAAERQRELLYLLEQDCGSCHGLRLKGGLGPPLLPADIAETPDEALEDVILLGRPGTPMPPWDAEISEAEVKWLVGRLRKGDVDYDQ